MLVKFAGMKGIRKLKLNTTFLNRKTSLLQTIVSFLEMWLKSIFFFFFFGLGCPLKLGEVYLFPAQIAS